MLLLILFGLRMGGDSTEAAVATPNICITLTDTSRLDVTLSATSRLDVTLTDTSRLDVTLTAPEC
jgi:hypothetical protein